MVKKGPGGKKKPLLQVDLGRFGGKHTFNTLEALETWLRDEQEAWQWVHSQLPSPSLLRQINQQKARISQSLQQAKIDKNQIANIPDALKSGYVDGSLIHSSTPAGKFILSRPEVKSRGVVAGAAFAYLRRADLSLNSAPMYQGVIEAALFEHGLASTAQAHREALDELFERAQGTLMAFDEARTDLQKKAHVNIRRTESQVIRHEEQHSDLMDEHQSRMNDTIAESKRKLGDLERTYDEKLALHAAVRF